MADRSLAPIVERRREIGELTDEDRRVLAAANGLPIQELPPRI
jgi:hypothetical protein